MNQYINKIRMLCDKKKVTLKKLATEIDVSETGFSQMLSNKSMKISTLQDIANYFQVPMTWFFEDEQQNIPGPDIDKVFDVLKEIVRKEMR